MHVTMTLLRLFVVCLLLPLALVACGAERSSSAVQPAAVQAQPVAVGQWGELIQRLERDHLASPSVKNYFATLPPYSPETMGKKINELYRIAFGPKRTPSKGIPSDTPLKARIYKGIVTQNTVDRCKDFIARNKVTFDTMERDFGVPTSIVAALLYVETRHGEFLGNENAFWVLASMANSNTPEKVRPALTGLTFDSSQESWLRSKLVQRSDWAYNELKALLSHCQVNTLNPHTIPGSMYGAIGLCQFMPSNIPLFAIDGNKNGKIDLFEEADAIHSVASYLVGHGWKKGASVDDQRKVLKKYNNLTVYANSILALGASVRTGVLHKAPPDIPWATAQPAKKKAAPATGAGKKQGGKPTVKPAAKKTTAAVLKKP